ncbi:carbohydrate ABC transporter permease [Paenibacillus alba]|uniref:Sugar ABC transporter permease n=1 Tax=Paenibacillus alba TaxID=1197127 RepID=A0ABU6G1Q7_9BACL|nr:sugar ABC transporter permease [Paenibacillus alba]MEC0227594.1 sugar ABC transporter permease [Paenibacillus alba]
MNNESKLFRFGLLFTLPATAIFLLFNYYPFISSLYYSFTQWDGINKPIFIGLKNYTDLFHDQAMLHGALHTLYIVVFGVIISNPLSLLLALLLDKPFRTKAILRTAFYLPVIISLVVVSIVWNFLLKYDGVINAVQTGLGLGSYTQDWLGNIHFALGMIILISVWQGTGFGAVIYLAGLQSIPKEILEAAELDGASGWRKVVYLIIPLIMPVVTICTFFGLVGSLKMFDLPYVLTNGGPGDATLTMAHAIYNFAFVNQTYGYSTAAGIVFMIICVIVTTIQLRITRKMEVEM